MCSVTAVKLTDGLRLIHNRDESVSRGQAERKPRPQVGDKGTFACPEDGVAGGSWVGVNQAGVLAFVLNRTSEKQAPMPKNPVSRGMLVPELLAAAGTVDEVSACLQQCPWDQLAPCRFVVILHEKIWDLEWDGWCCRLHQSTLKARQAWWSSGIGDQKVIGPRAKTFTHWQGDLVLASEHHKLHQAQFSDDGAIDIAMDRKTHRTVSWTEITLGPLGAEMVYRPWHPTEGGAVHRVSVPIDADGAQIS